jgi:hypothetical protein
MCNQKWPTLDNDMYLMVHIAMGASFNATETLFILCSSLSMCTQ